MASTSPERHPAENDPHVDVHLKTGLRDDGDTLAIAYALWGEDTVVLDVEVCKTRDDAQAWYERVKVERPWIERQ
jgi:hypothetical protein